ncbi:arrestin domain-containing protein 17-like isoform 1-T1 [Cochliomyia hominivorax]
MPSTCEFELNHPNAVYHSGEIVSGTIILNTTSPKDVRDVCILFHGEGKVHWTETRRQRNHDGTSRSHTEHFRSNELYVDNTTTVFGEGTLPAGTHTYTFQIILPPECPTSCEGRHGHIRYELTLKLRRSFRFDNIFSKPLTVIKTQDLNLNPIYRVPIQSEEIFVPWFCSCTTGNINTTLTIPYSGYAIGQNITFSLHTQNRSMDDIQGYLVEFIRKINFTARTPHHKVRVEKSTLFSKLYETRCLRLSTRILEGNFLIPSTPPSTLGEAIISVYYYIKFTLVMSCCTSNKILTVPIIIGTVALREGFLRTESQLITITPTAPEMPMDNDDDGNDLPPSYKDLGPPTFEEAIRSSSPFIDIDKDEQNRHIGFRPLYPSYSQSYD